MDNYPTPKWCNVIGRNTKEFPLIYNLNTQTHPSFSPERPVGSRYVRMNKAQQGIYSRSRRHSRSPGTSDEEREDARYRRRSSWDRDSVRDDSESREKTISSHTTEIHSEDRKDEAKNKEYESRSESSGE